MPSMMPWMQQFALTPPMRVWAAKVPRIVVDNVAAMDWGETIRQAATICDLTSFATLGLALGVRQVRSMEAVVDDEDLEGPGNCKVRRFDDAQSFMTFMDAWVGVARNGVVQFKFQASSGAHTFAVERYLPGTGLPPLFQVYQAYQGAYRLSDFLGLTNVRDLLLPRLIISNRDRYERATAGEQNVPVFDYNLANPPPGLTLRVTNAWNSYKSAITRELNRNATAVEGASNLLRRPLSKNDFLSRVVYLLRDMFAGTQNFHLLSGHLSSDAVQARRILVMTGNYDAANLANNMRDVRSGFMIAPGFVNIDNRRQEERGHD